MICVFFVKILEAKLTCLSFHYCYNIREGIPEKKRILQKRTGIEKNGRQRLKHIQKG